jgi:hypothetical protein
MRRRRRLLFKDEAVDLVEQLALDHGVSVPDVVRRALGRERWFTEVTRKGGRIFFQGEGEEEPHEVRFVWT